MSTHFVINILYSKLPLKRMTDISKLGEFKLIDHLTKDIQLQNQSTKLGVGDDCAVMHYPDKEVLMTTDMLMEGVHFDLTYIDMQHLGYKSATVSYTHLTLPTT